MRIVRARSTNMRRSREIVEDPYVEEKYDGQEYEENYEDKKDEGGEYL